LQSPSWRRVPNRNSFALHKGEFEPVLAGLRDGRVDLAFVVAVKLGRPYEYQAAEFAEALAATVVQRLTESTESYGRFSSTKLIPMPRRNPITGAAATGGHKALVSSLSHLLPGKLTLPPTGAKTMTIQFDEEAQGRRHDARKCLSMRHSHRNRGR
jgi:hypothetical protein